MGRLIPEEGGFLNCQLPGELIRSVVKQVVSNDLCIVQLAVSTPMAKAHGYKKDDIVPVKRSRDSLGQEIWLAISEHEMEAAARAEAEETERKAQVAAEEAAAAPPPEPPRPVAHAFTISKAGE